MGVGGDQELDHIANGEDNLSQRPLSHTSNASPNPNTHPEGRNWVIQEELKTQPYFLLNNGMGKEWPGAQTSFLWAALHSPTEVISSALDREFYTEIGVCLQ